MKKFDGFTVNGKPFFVLGAQSHNSSSYSRGMFGEAVKSALALNCNTLEAPIYWEVIEPREGEFNFDCIDFMVEMCREAQLKLIILWFASWKNGDMSYAPGWVKEDQSRFQRVLRSDGTAVPSLSAHCEANRDADARAFSKVMSYIRDIDEQEQTVIAMQVQNEPGYLRTDRDYSSKALENAKNAVPEKLLLYLESHTHAPAYKHWMKAGLKRGEDWESTFGFWGAEFCEAWHLALYIDFVAAAGKRVYDIPMYINVWLNSGNPWGVPGMEYPGGGAVERTLHVWFTAVEHIDMIAPDIYEQNSYRYKNIIDCYAADGNALFIPESSGFAKNAVNMFYAIAKGAVGCAVFGAEGYLDNDGNVIEPALAAKESHIAIRNAIPLILKHRNTGKIYPVISHDGQQDEGYEFEEFLGNVIFGTNRYLPDRPLYTDYSNRRLQINEDRQTPRGIIIEDEPRLFYLAGYFHLRLMPKKSPEISRICDYLPVADFISVEEGYFNEQGDFVAQRTRNGDQVMFGGFWVTPTCGIVRVRLL